MVTVVVVVMIERRFGRRTWNMQCTVSPCLLTLSPGAPSPSPLNCHRTVVVVAYNGTPFDHNLSFFYSQFFRVFLFFLIFSLLKKTTTTTKKLATIFLLNLLHPFYLFIYIYFFNYSKILSFLFLFFIYKCNDKLQFSELISNF